MVHIASITGFAAVAGLSFAIYRMMASKKRKRAMSFNSSALVEGPFPVEAKVAPPVINISTYYAQCPSEEKMAATLSSLLVYDRFRCSAVKSNGSWRFVEVQGGVDVQKNHIFSSSVNGEKELLAEVDRICNSDIEGYGTRPLWCAHRIVNNGDGVSAVVFRVHHVIGDGIGLVATMSNIFIDEKTNEAVRLEIPEKMRSNDGKKAHDIFLIFKLFSALFEVLGLALSRFDSAVAFNEPDRNHLNMGAPRGTIHFPTLSLDFVKKVKKNANATVNDVLFSAMSGAIRRYCEKRGDLNLSAKSMLLRALMPVAFPRPKKELSNPSRALRNKWAFISVPMPMRENDASRRLEKCQSITRRLKKSFMAIVQLWLQSNVMEYLPSFLQRKTAFDVFSRHSIVFSNVPGPDAILRFAGERMVGLQIIFPNILPQVIIISYGGRIFCNMSADLKFLKDAEKDLPEMFLQEVKDMAEHYQVSTAPEFMLSDHSLDSRIGVISTN